MRRENASVKVMAIGMVANASNSWILLNECLNTSTQ
jgi:hypothetical protein